ncbi:MAG: 50S ribosomal protein L11 methyltransferase [Parachlamydiales bacterium]|nr:50S ribosomal protein L11 methyltransferase [Parachlamydiales bacterium]
MSVDWHEQWALFAQNFYDGKAHIPVGEKTLLLTPGAGFGDLSHPTTQLMIEMMQAYTPGETVVDIGTGSGILALAALLMGAKSAIGIDIDPDAIKHARKNAKLNGLKARFGKTLPKNFNEDTIFLMNMILSEQRAVQPQRYKGKLWIVSGILIDQKKLFLDQAQKWGWKMVSMSQKSEWCGFILQ